MLGALAIGGCTHHANRDARSDPPILSDGRPSEAECRGAPMPDRLALVLRAPDREAAGRPPSEADRRAYNHYVELRNLGNGPRELLEVLLTIGPSRNWAGVAALIAQAQAALGLDTAATANADLAAELARQEPARPEVARIAAQVADVTRPRIASLRFDLRHTPSDAKVWMDGVPVADGATLRLDAGPHHRVSAFGSSGGPCRQRMFDLGPGERVEVRVADEIEILVAR
jgi:hypothetical protein